MSKRSRRQRRDHQAEIARQFNALTADLLAGNDPAMLPERRALVPRNLPRPEGDSAVAVLQHLFATAPFRELTRPGLDCSGIGGYSRVDGYDPDDADD